MLELLQSFFGDGLFIPHGHCYLWQPKLVWLHIISDSLIAIAYYSIPITLVYFAQKREDFPFKWILLLFGTFIVSCGTTHVMEVWTLWHPTYWLSGAIKFFTASVSVYTAIILVPIVPQALALPSPAQLEAANSQLKMEIIERKAVEEALLKAKQELEIRVEERTSELKAAMTQSQENAAIAQEQAAQLEIALKKLANTQAQLVQTEKMSSLGQLVAGVAHEINNPVNFIYGNTIIANEYAESLLSLISLYQENYSQPPTEIQDYTDEIDLDFIQKDLPRVLYSMTNGANRISEIVQSLRTFSRLDEAEIKQVNVHDGIDSTLLLLKSHFKGKVGNPDIQVIKQYGDLPKIECYPGQLNQVFMYILNNAIDAINALIKTRINSLDAYQGKITVATEALNSDEIIIRIIDNGCGMSEEVRQKVFDPFFTTKPVGSGTGLGMSVSYQIIQMHHGHLRCVSLPDEGTEFQIQIPILMKSPVQQL
ncbi:two-component sensor histidine kinase [Nostoc carneum NIES-2107]|nr:two-component sensor histidine kinase [Nostoc carneum NIES-2107]